MKPRFDRRRESGIEPWARTKVGPILPLSVAPEIPGRVTPLTRLFVAMFQVIVEYFQWLPAASLRDESIVR